MCVDLAKLILTHHHLKNLGRQAMPLGVGMTPKLEPITEAGSRSVQEPHKAYMGELIRKLHELFEGELADLDKPVHVNNVIKGKRLESERLKQPAAINTKEQFANSPDLKAELPNAIIGALDAHTLMRTQALKSSAVLGGLKDILLNQVQYQR
jgi:type I restriction enzyme, R subunit